MNVNWLTPELLTGIDRLIDARDVPPARRLSREEAIQMIVRDWLQGQGYVALPDGETVVPVIAASRVPRDA
jgi:hypothetical protein